MKTVLSVLALAFALAGAAVLAQMPIPAPPSVGASGYILMDHQTGHVVAERNGDAPLEPASLTKLMTAYVVFGALAQGTIGIDDEVSVSVRAWRTPGSRMFIQEGTRVPVHELLRGMIVVSGNDASVALAEHVAGSEEAFADLMNHYAGELGMTRSRFYNSTGLPAEGHITTAADMARLTRAIISDFPEYYQLYSELEYTWGDITQPNRNNLLRRDPSVDGVKTGHTNAAGYCLITSAGRGDMRLISVVMGTASPRAREDASQALLNYGFMFYETHRLYAAGDAVTSARVWKGADDEIEIGVREDIWVTVPRGRRDQLDAELELPTVLTAPLSDATALGEMRIRIEDSELVHVPLFALRPVAEGGLWRKARDTVLLWLE
jgi:serine-type D-Ala-D-Ala carboxypeptidase (penicillin-binding protein 5/6)